VFLQRPICAALLLVTLGIVATALWKKRKFSAAIAGEE
jgi:hypothetical protein